MILFGVMEVALSQFPSLENITWVSAAAAAMSLAYSLIGLGLCAALWGSHGEVRGTIAGASAATSAAKTWNALQALGNVAFAYTFAEVLIEIQVGSATLSLLSSLHVAEFSIEIQMAFFRSLSLPCTFSEFSIEIQVGFHHFLSVHLSASISPFLVPYFHLYLNQALSLPPLLSVLLSSSFSHTLSHNLSHPSLFPSILQCKYIYLSLSVSPCLSLSLSACTLHSLSIFFSQTSLSLASLSLLNFHLSASISPFLVPYFHLYLNQALSLPPLLSVLLSSSFSHTLSHNLSRPSLFPSILQCKYIYLSLSVSPCLSLSLSACTLHSLSIFFSQTSLSLASLSLLNFHTRQNIALSNSISLKISLSNGNRGTVPGYVKIAAGGERDDEAGDEERDRADVSLLRGGGLRGLRRLRELGAGEYSHRIRLLRALLARRPGQPLHRHPPRRRVSGTLPRERNTRKALSLSLRADLSSMRS